MEGEICIRQRTALITESNQLIVWQPNWIWKRRGAMAVAKAGVAKDYAITGAVESVHSFTALTLLLK